LWKCVSGKRSVSSRPRWPRRGRARFRVERQTPLALRGALRMRLRELREARDDYAAAAALYDRLAASREALDALDRLTVVLDEMDEREEALRVLDAEVRPRAERLADRPSVLRARERIARHHAAARRMDEALAGFRALVEAHERDGNLADALYLEVAVAQIHLARGDALHARNDFTRLVDAARRLALPECEASATLGKAHALVTMGEHKGALEALGVLEGLVRAHRLSATFDAIVAQLRGQISQPAVAAP
jgi:tetratricopeptide (TPR) repeat protein